MAAAAGGATTVPLAAASAPVFSAAVASSVAAGSSSTGSGSGTLDSHQASGFGSPADFAAAFSAAHSISSAGVQGRSGSASVGMLVG